MMRVLGCTLVILLAGCPVAPVGVGRAEVPRDSAPQCGSLCESIGLPLDSVVIMADNVGCVCRATPPATTAAPGASASAGGMAAIMLAQQAARQQAAQQQQQQQQNSYKPKY